MTFASTSPALRVLGQSTTELQIKDSSTIVVQRPRTTLTKSFELGAIFGEEASTTECFVATIAPSIRPAVKDGRSAFVLALGAEKSGKSTSVRGGSDGFAFLAVRETFEAIATAAADESLVTFSAVLNTIMPTHGAGSEHIIDALGGDSPSAGLQIRERSDHLPHHDRFFAEGLLEKEVRSAADAERLIEQALARCAQEEAGPALRVHLLLTLTIRQKTADGRERASVVSILDAASVPRGAAPRAGGAAVGGRGAVAGGRGAAGGGRAAGSGRGGGGGGSDDPFLKGFYRIVDALQEGSPAHVPFRDSKLTKLLAPCLGGGAVPVPVLHVRADKFEEAEAILSLVPKLQRLRSLAAAGTPTSTANVTVAVSTDGWWSPQAEYEAAERRAEQLAAALGLERSGLLSSGIELDHTSSDEMLAFQEALLLSERLQARMGSWQELRDGGRSRVTGGGGQCGGGGIAPPPPRAIVGFGGAGGGVHAAPAEGGAGASTAALRELPSQRSALPDASKLKLIHRKTGGVAGGPYAPAPGCFCSAQFGNGEYYRAKVTATSRADDGSLRYVVRFEDDGVTLHLPIEKLRRA